MRSSFYRYKCLLSTVSRFVGSWLNFSYADGQRDLSCNSPPRLLQRVRRKAAPEARYRGEIGRARQRRPEQNASTFGVWTFADTVESAIPLIVRLTLGSLKEDIATAPLDCRLQP